MAEKQTETDSERALYDLGFHLVESLAEDAVEAEVKKLHALVEKADGKILKERMPVRIPLAYTISRMTKGKREDFTSAYFGTVIFDGSRGSIHKLEKALAAEAAVLRYLLVETDEFRAEETLKVGKEPEKAEGAPEVSDEELDKSIESLTT